MEVTKSLNMIRRDIDEKNSDATIRKENDDTVLCKFGLRDICSIALWLPLGALVFCFVSACIFQWEDIHETHCKVYNVVPSISAITGISPQRYLWRISIALHLGPRLLLGSIYYGFHSQRSNYITDEKNRSLAAKLTNACYWLNWIEIGALTGVTYISNRENYPLHEKIFTIFMISSLCHMLCRAIVGGISQEQVKPPNGNKMVWLLFIVSIIATIGLIIFFLRHRFLCKPLAFTWFSVCEYVIACANMAFHATVLQDFPHYHLQIIAFESNKKNM